MENFFFLNIDPILNFLSKTDTNNLKLVNSKFFFKVKSFDISNGSENYKIKYNSEIKIDFIYISKNIYEKRINVLKIEYGCECEDCSIDENCECFERMYKKKVYDNRGILIINEKSIEYPIFECIPNICKCDDKCMNKNIQKGIVLKDIEIFEKKKKRIGSKL